MIASAIVTALSLVVPAQSSDAAVYVPPPTDLMPAEDGTIPENGILYLSRESDIENYEDAVALTIGDSTEAQQLTFEMTCSEESGEYACLRTLALPDEVEEGDALVVAITTGGDEETELTLNLTAGPTDEEAPPSIALTVGELTYYSQGDRPGWYQQEYSLPANPSDDIKVVELVRAPAEGETEGKTQAYRIVNASGELSTALTLVFRDEDVGTVCHTVVLHDQAGNKTEVEEQLCAEVNEDVATINRDGEFFLGCAQTSRSSAMLAGFFLLGLGLVRRRR